MGGFEGMADNEASTEKTKYRPFRNLAGRRQLNPKGRVSGRAGVYVGVREHSQATLEVTHLPREGR